jgi:Lsr2
MMREVAMASRVTIELIDDLDGRSADETVGFELDGKGYEIDLSTSNAGRLRKALEPFTAVARATGRGRARRATLTRDFDPVAVRKWAASNGIEVSKRGRIPGDVLSQFHAAGN